MIKHIVFWNFKESNEHSAEENKKTAAEMLRSLPEKIESIIDFEIGENFNESETAFQLSLYSSFKNKAALQDYQVHPEHQKVAEFIKAHTSKRAVVDYEL